MSGEQPKEVAPNPWDLDTRDMRKVDREEFYSKVSYEKDFHRRNWSGDIWYFHNTEHAGKRIQQLSTGKYDYYLHK